MREKPNIKSSLTRNENKIEPPIPIMIKPAVRRFDAYQFFKLEYQTSHQNKEEEELEKVS
jgi:hypothetical protein